MEMPQEIIGKDVGLNVKSSYSTQRAIIIAAAYYLRKVHWLCVRVYLNVFLRCFRVVGIVVAVGVVRVCGGGWRACLRMFVRVSAPLVMRWCARWWNLFRYRGFFSGSEYVVEVVEF